MGSSFSLDKALRSHVASVQADSGGGPISIAVDPVIFSVLRGPNGLGPHLHFENVTFASKERGWWPEALDHHFSAEDVPTHPKTGDRVGLAALTPDPARVEAFSTGSILIDPVGRRSRSDPGRVVDGYAFAAMPQSYSGLYVHLVFGTKLREPSLSDANLRADLHAYMGGASKGLGCPTFLVGGVEDHVHIVASLSRTVAVADWVRELKKASTGWVQRHGVPRFGWQDGFGAFSFDREAIPDLVQYVANQAEHHRKVSFEEEDRRLLVEAGVEFDEKYLFV